MWLLSSAAIRILEGLPRNSETYIFPAHRGNGHYLGTPKVCNKVKQLAGLADVRLHDLCHTVASVAVSSGTSLLITGALLGHKDPGTTQRYAHLSNNPVQRAAETVGQKLALALTGFTETPNNEIEEDD